MIIRIKRSDIIAPKLVSQARKKKNQLPKVQFLTKNWQKLVPNNQVALFLSFVLLLFFLEF